VTTRQYIVVQAWTCALNNNNGNLNTGDNDRANLLNYYFALMCLSDNGILDRVVPENSNHDNIEFTPDDIYAANRKLKLIGASGPDGSPPQLICTLADILAELLSPLFTSFMSIGKIQLHCKHAVGTPVFYKQTNRYTIQA